MKGCFDDIFNDDIILPMKKCQNDTVDDFKINICVSYIICKQG